MSHKLQNPDLTFHQEQKQEPSTVVNQNTVSYQNCFDVKKINLSIRQDIEDQRQNSQDLSSSNQQFSGFSHQNDQSSQKIENQNSVNDSQDKSESTVFMNGNRQVNLQNTFGDLSKIECHDQQNKQDHSAFFQAENENLKKNPLKQVQSPLKFKTSLTPQTNLSFAIANRYPSTIKDQVFKMIQYYQKTITQQNKSYHQLVQVNKKLKKKIYDKDSLLSSSAKKKRIFNNEPFINQQNVQINNKVENDRISDLEDKLLMKDKQILKLNAEIGQLYSKLKKRSKNSQKKNSNKNQILIQQQQQQ